MLFMLKDSFLKYLQFEKNYSDKTIVSYGIDLEKFVNNLRVWANPKHANKSFKHISIVYE